MTVIVDAGPLVAAADEVDPRCADAERLFTGEPGPFVVPSPVTAEVDHLLARRVGRRSRTGFLGDLAAGRFIVPCLELADYATIMELESRYADLDPGLADLSLVIMAERLGTRRIATFDERHFRVLRPLQGGSFELLPADA